MASTVLVTGATRGLGKAVAMGLARTAATVVIVARDPHRGAVVAEEIRASRQSAEAHVLVGDVARITDVRRIAAEVAAKHPRLSLLVNNAGVVKFSQEVTEDGLETTFATNHLAPFLLSNQLIHLLAENVPARIVNVTSEQHRWAPGFPGMTSRANGPFNRSRPTT